MRSYRPKILYPYHKTGKARAIRFSTLEALCRALECAPANLLEFRAHDGA